MADDSVTFTQNYKVYEPGELGAYLISEPEWDRLKRLTQRVSPGIQWLQNAAWACFGVGISAAFAYLSYANATGLPTWVVPTTIAIGIAAFFLFVVLLLLDRDRGKHRRNTVNEVIEEIELIEKRCRDTEAGTLSSSDALDLVQRYLLRARLAAAGAARKEEDQTS